ncbi:hypothetical protein BLNAU_13236 [Blattamonas nauphoetae]|uniref:Uncharacterized protein n=1 Tax=Blattamonas nauphoetae TaxID=2049346 RepID=A0ABQ9XNN9_9EUKA|nr:hypothetical protein BLNAU_13236 [Blattamonas nauphoetae]
MDPPSTSDSDTVLQEDLEAIQQIYRDYQDLPQLLQQIQQQYEPVIYQLSLMNENLKQQIQSLSSKEYANQQEFDSILVGLQQLASQEKQTIAQIVNEYESKISTMQQNTHDLIIQHNRELLDAKNENHSERLKLNNEIELLTMKNSTLQRQVQLLNEQFGVRMDSFAMSSTMAAQGGPQNVDQLKGVISELQNELREAQNERQFQREREERLQTENETRMKEEMRRRIEAENEKREMESELYRLRRENELLCESSPAAIRREATGHRPNIRKSKKTVRAADTDHSESDEHSKTSDDSMDEFFPSTPHISQSAINEKDGSRLKPSGVHNQPLQHKPDSPQSLSSHVIPFASYPQSNPQMHTGHLPPEPRQSDADEADVLDDSQRTTLTQMEVKLQNVLEEKEKLQQKLLKKNEEEKLLQKTLEEENQKVAELEAKIRSLLNSLQSPLEDPNRKDESTPQCHLTYSELFEEKQKQEEVFRRESESLRKRQRELQIDLQNALMRAQKLEQGRQSSDHPSSKPTRSQQPASDTQTKEKMTKLKELVKVMKEQLIGREREINELKLTITTLREEVEMKKKVIDTYKLNLAAEMRKGRTGSTSLETKPTPLKEEDEPQRSSREEKEEEEESGNAESEHEEESEEF